MSEEKKELLKKEYDYSKKDYYQLLNLEKDASNEKINSTTDELEKKYNPITNPDEIKKYQEISEAGEILRNPISKQFYDDYGEISITLFNFFSEVFPWKNPEKPKSYVNKCLAAVFGICLILVGFDFFLFPRYSERHDWPWIYTFAPIVVILVCYLIYRLCSLKNDLKYIDTKNKDAPLIKKRILLRHGLICVKAVLLIVFQFTLARYFENGHVKSRVFCPLLPYFAFEAVNLIKDTLNFKCGLDAINTGKDVPLNSLLSEKTYVKYLVGKANKKDKNGKTGSKFSSTLSLFIYLYVSDILRLIQVICLAVAYKNDPPQYTKYIIPSIILVVFHLGHTIYQSTTGYVRTPKETILAIAFIVMYATAYIDLQALVDALDRHKWSLDSHSFFFMIIVLVIGGLSVGIFPFLLIMEYKMKHGELDMPQ